MRSSHANALYRGFQVHCPKVKCLNHVHAYNFPLSLKKWCMYPRPVIMPIPYSVDLRWRVVWMHLAHNRSPADIAQLLCISEHTVRQCLTLFYQTGDVEPRPRTNGPKKLLGDFEQVVPLQLVLAYPGMNNRVKYKRCLGSLLVHLQYARHSRL